MKNVAQKLCPPRPLEVFYIFGGKSKFWASMTLIFCAKRVFIEVNNWWKFGVDISIQLGKKILIFYTKRVLIEVDNW